MAPVGITRSHFTPPAVSGSWKQPGGSEPISPKASIAARRCSRVGAGSPGAGWRDANSALTPAISGSFQLDITRPFLLIGARCAPAVERAPAQRQFSVRVSDGTPPRIAFTHEAIHTGRTQNCP